MKLSKEDLEWALAVIGPAVLAAKASNDPAMDDFAVDGPAVLNILRQPIERALRVAKLSELCAERAKATGDDPLFWAISHYLKAEAECTE